MNKVINYDLHNNMLIIGKANTNYGILEPHYWNNPSAVSEAYGEKSNLTYAFNEAYNIGVKDIFLLNIQKQRDYLEVIDTIKQNDFAYIVFTDLFVSDTFSDAADAEKIHNYFAYMLGTIGLKHESVFFVTDKHASLFETLDDYIDYMNNTVGTFKTMCSGKANLENIVITANNLKEKDFANVTLASVICTTAINKYPEYDFGEPIFYIDSTDFPNDYAYFKTQTVRKTTVENLINCKQGGPEKVFPVSRILKYIKRAVDYSEFKGRFYTPYIKLKINKKLNDFLTSIKGIAINDFEIIDIAGYKSAPGAVDIICRFNVLPAFSFELCRIEKEVIF